MIIVNDDGTRIEYKEYLRRKSMKKRANLVITHELLKEALGIPEELQIVGIWQDAPMFQSDQMLVALSGEGLPETPEGAEAVRMDMSAIYKATGTPIGKMVDKMEERQYTKDKFIKMMEGLTSE